MISAKCRFWAFVLLAGLCILLYHPSLQLLEALRRDGLHCFYHQLVPQQMVLLHFKKTLPEFQFRYYGGTWQDGGWQPTGKDFKDLEKTWQPLNRNRNACEMTQAASRHAVLDHLVRQRELNFSQRARDGSYCVGYKCRRHFLTVVSAAKGEEDYMLEWVDFHLSSGVDFLIIGVQTTADEKNARSLLKNHLTAGLVELRMGDQTAIHHYAFEFRLNETWWLARIDMDAFLYSPLDGSVFDFLASTTDLQNYPEQYLVPRFDMGDNGHTKQPGEFMANAYTRATPLPEIFQALLHAPAGQERQVDERGPHNFGRVYRSCEAIIRLGPFLFCPKSFVLPYVVGWPGSGSRRVTFVPSRRGEQQPAHATAGVEGGAGPPPRFLSVSGLCLALSCSLCMALCAERTCRGKGDYSAGPEQEHRSGVPAARYGKVALSDPDE